MKSLNTRANIELTKAFDESSFVADVFIQLSKEFAKVGVLIEFTPIELQSFDNFKERLIEEMELVMRASPSRIDQLLYLSDLQESKVRSVFRENENPIEELAKMLLIRSAEKVHFRKQYSLGML